MSTPALPTSRSPLQNAATAYNSHPSDQSNLTQTGRLPHAPVDGLRTTPSSKTHARRIFPSLPSTDADTTPYRNGEGLSSQAPSSNAPKKFEPTSTFTPVESTLTQWIKALEATSPRATALTMDEHQVIHALRAFLPQDHEVDLPALNKTLQLTPPSNQPCEATFLDQAALVILGPTRCQAWVHLTLLSKIILSSGTDHASDKNSADAETTSNPEKRAFDAFTTLMLRFEGSPEQRRQLFDQLYPAFGQYILAQNLSPETQPAQGALAALQLLQTEGWPALQGGKDNITVIPGLGAASVLLALGVSGSPNSGDIKRPNEIPAYLNPPLLRQFQRLVEIGVLTKDNLIQVLAAHSTRSTDGGDGAPMAPSLLPSIVLLKPGDGLAPAVKQANQDMQQLTKTPNVIEQLPDLSDESTAASAAFTALRIAGAFDGMFTTKTMPFAGANGTENMVRFNKSASLQAVLVQNPAKETTEDGHTLVAVPCTLTTGQSVFLVYHHHLDQLGSLTNGHLAEQAIAMIEFAAPQIDIRTAAEPMKNGSPLTPGALGLPEELDTLKIITQLKVNSKGFEASGSAAASALRGYSKMENPKYVFNTPHFQTLVMVDEGAGPDDSPMVLTIARVNRL